MVHSEDRDSNAAVCRDGGESGENPDYLAVLTEGAAESAEFRPLWPSGISQVGGLGHLSQVIPSPPCRERRYSPLGCSLKTAA